jgi:hypothetical protein
VGYASDTVRQAILYTIETFKCAGKGIGGWLQEFNFDDCHAAKQVPSIQVQVWMLSVQHVLSLPGLAQHLMRGTT